jgi:hypothetical protein
MAPLVFEGPGLVMTDYVEKKDEGKMEVAPVHFNMSYEKNAKVKKIDKEIFEWQNKVR